jgi:hypothetical protein
VSNRIDFIIAGVQKAGTTALHALLTAHPGLLMPAPKELHYFDNETNVDWRKPDYSLYERHFSGRLPSQICGEATPSYIYWPESIERIRAYNPAIKLIILLSDPILRAHSAWVMERARGVERLSFSEAIREGRSRLMTEPSAFRGHHRNFSYVERGFYAAQLDRVYRNFPRQQVLVLLNDDIVDDHGHVLGRLAEFLGIGDIDPTPLLVRHSPNMRQHDIEPISPADIEYLRSVYLEDFARLKANIQEDFSRWNMMNP